MKLNTNSNIYTFVYMTVVVVIVAVLLAVVSSALKPLKDANVLLDKQKQILGALKFDLDSLDTDPATKYLSLVNDTLTFGEKEVYVANLDGEVKYILPLEGKGLWGGIGGYLVLNEDKNTIYGVNFNHEGETPGLGAKITEYKIFRKQFEGTHIRNEEGKVVSVAVLKSGKIAEGKDQVDAISGATITSEGVSKMLEEELINNYKEFLSDVPAAEENVEPIEEKEAEDVESED
jgi:Na+-transporting NADH:ubiquinone oxidoreductase subunit C